MPDYTTPPINNVPFTFSSKGYTSPSFGNIPFNFTPTYVQTANLQSTISVMGLYQDSTYTYLKGCPKVVVGFGIGMQVIQLPCEYGGIRDIGSNIHGNPENRDLGGYVYTISYFGSLDSYIKGTIRLSTDLASFVRPCIPSSKDLGSAIRRLDHGIKNIPSYIRGWLGLGIPYNLSSSIGAIPPVDLGSIMNIIDVSNMPATITGEWWHGTKDLSSEIPSISSRHYLDLKHTLHSWQLQDLAGQARAMLPVDLGAILNAGTFGATKDLGGFITYFSPILLWSTIHGWDVKNLPAYLNGVYGPGDIRASIYPVLPADLKSIIHVYEDTEVPIDLPSRLTSFYVKNLGGILRSIQPYDLGAYINAVGGAKDLPAYIIPKIIKISSIFKISLLEHKDLVSVINCFCASSDYKDLPAYTYAISKKDLRSYILGWRGDMADNVKDLRFYINTGDYYVENKIDISSAITITPRYSELDVRFNSAGVSKTLNYIDASFTTKYHLDLSAYINGEMRYTDLNSRITAFVPYNYTTLPEWVNPKTREVFINLTRFEQRTVRFVDLMFDAVGNDMMQYFYVEDENKVYKSSKDKKWTLWFTGYSRTTDEIKEKYAIRRKVLFDLTKYDTVDEAVRDLMTRVAEYNKINLTSSISGSLPNHMDLNSFIESRYTRHWYKHLFSRITPLYIGTEDLPQYIDAIWPSDSLNLSSSIVGKTYEPPAPDAADFNFIESGYSSPAADNANVSWTNTQAEEFWK